MPEHENHSGAKLDVTEGAAPPAARETLAKAVALEYERESDQAPRVVASGKGAVAEQILSLAFTHGVRVREDADLVEVLSKVDVDSVIPLEAFAAVAEILSYVYRMNAHYGDPRHGM